MVMLVIGLLFSGFHGWQAWDKLEEAQAKVVQTENQFEKYRIQTGKELDAGQVKFDTIQIELGTVQTERDAIQTELEVTQTELELVKVELQITEARIEAQKIYYEQKLIEEFEKGRLEGYETALTREVSLRNPTYEELRDFLAQDKTNLNAYVPGKYVCVDFAADLNNNAEAAGIRAGYTWLVYRYINGGKWANFVNAFQTTDKGLIFIDPQTDREVNIEIGKYYLGNKIKEIIIIW
jgi:hypothetical protein